MNSNKFNFYKNAVYFLIANGVLALASIVVMCIFGFNLDSSVQAGNIIFASSMSIILSMLAIFLYILFRENFAKAFSAILIIANNVILSTALICILRIPVSDSLLMGYILIVAITALYFLIATEKFKNVNFKKVNKNEVITDALNSSIKQILTISAIIAVVLLLGLIIASTSMFDLVREFLVMLFVIIYSYITIQLPIWCYFASKITAKKRVKVDKGVENQKVVKAVTIDGDTEVEDGAVIEENSETESDEPSNE
jgi:preprotein translocase subunit SecF